MKQEVIDMTVAEPKLHRWARNENDRRIEPGPFRWTRDQYYRMAEEGWFEGQRVQLIQGEVVDMPPMLYPHVHTVIRVRKALERIFGPDHWVFEEKPLKIGELSEPEPDVAVCEHPMDSYTDHPTTALLVVEVSDSSLRLDRRKAGLYASAGVPEYWIVDLNGRRMEVYRQPMADESVEFGWRYGQMRTLEESDTLDLLARPEAHIAVRDILP